MSRGGCEVFALALNPCNQLFGSFSGFHRVLSRSAGSRPSQKLELSVAGRGGQVCLRSQITVLPWTLATA